MIIYANKNYYTNFQNKKICYNNITKRVNMDTNNLDAQELGKILQQKSTSLPDIMDSMVFALGAYLSNRMNVTDFLKRYFYLTENMIKRAELGRDSENYKKVYDSELTMLQKIGLNCNEYQSKNLSKTEFDKQLQEQVKLYLETPKTKNTFYTL